MTNHVLGRSDSELARLSEQGRLYEPGTRQMILEAGVRPGDAVLDVGCGAGDVSLLPANAVGPRGRVLAVDRAPEAVDTTRRRAAAAGCGWLDAVQGVVEALPPSERFDGVFGQFVLLHVPEPVSLLRHLRGLVRPGGVVAFAELDVSTLTSDPPSSILEAARGWIAQALARSGAQPDMGGKLYAAYRAVGLDPRLATFCHVDVGSASATIGLVSNVVASLAPALEEMGLASANEINDLARRWREEAGNGRRAFYAPRLTMAVARTLT